MQSGNCPSRDHVARAGTPPGVLLLPGVAQGSYQGMVEAGRPVRLSGDAPASYATFGTALMLHVPRYGPGCALPPTTPAANIHTLVASARKYGTYGHS